MWAEFEMRYKALFVQILFRLNSYFPNLNGPSLIEAQDKVPEFRASPPPPNSFSPFTAILQKTLRTSEEACSSTERIRKFELKGKEEKAERVSAFEMSDNRGKTSAVTLGIPVPLEL